MSLKWSGTSALFDIALQGESDGHISHHQHLGGPVKLQAKLKSAISYNTTSSNNQELTSNNTSEANSTIISYSANWVTFVPDIIIDAKQGLMWKVQVKLDATLCKRWMHYIDSFLIFPLDRIRFPKAHLHQQFYHYVFL